MRRNRRWPLMLAMNMFLAAGASCACAQGSAPATASGADPALAAKLAEAAAQEHALETSLPAFTCTETGVSEVRRGDQVKKHVAFTGEIRARRDAQGQLIENHVLTTVNGKRAEDDAFLPFYVQEAFAGVLKYIAADSQPCFQYTLDADGRVHFASIPPLKMSCANFPGLQGTATFDAGGNVTQLQRTVPFADDPGWPVPAATVDLAPVDLDGQTYRLASRLVAEREHGNDTLHLDVSYTNCRLFKTDVRILTGPQAAPPR